MGRQTVDLRGSAPMRVEDGEPQGELSPWQPPCVHRSLPLGEGLETWVHAYTGADADRWQRLARAMAGRGKPDALTLAVAQLCVVCRCGPEPDAEPTFTLNVHSAERAFAALCDLLPEALVKRVCEESDAKTLEGYYLPAGVAKAGREAVARFGEQLADPEFWGALNYLSQKLCGVPLVDNGQPLGHVLSVALYDREAQATLINGVAAMAGAGGFGG
jgi:hypothetical protein